MIANFNVENAYVIILKDKLYNFEALSFLVLKKIIITAMISIFIAVISFFQGIFLDTRDSGILIIFFQMIMIDYFNFKLYTKIRYASKFDRAYQILNSDEFESIYVNNEELFSVIQLISNSIGQYQCLMNIIKCEFIFIIICAIITLSLFFS